MGTFADARNAFVFSSISSVVYSAELTPKFHTFQYLIHPQMNTPHNIISIS